ncbi:ATP-grasp domain-containing protein [Yersinia wautersii]|uniref:Acetyl-CoA carboxylase n=1 Tax=Yersinia wautersii TaxID=1341643 RepID=A0ABM9TCI9_9GAMM|nr:ATP-grasp domain-containing protein [Yersinia wautersii]CRG49487.1 acetyl-CoA carboxylase [Yersinia wautersii]
MRKIIMVGSQDEIFEELPPNDVELYVIQPEKLIGPALKAAAAAVYPVEGFTTEAVLNGARHFCDRFAIDALFSFTEYGLLPAAEAAQQLGLPGIDLQVTELCRNKWKLRQALSDTDFRLPFKMAETRHEVTAFAQENGFPLVLKDPSGVGSINVKICHSLTEAHDFFDRLMAEAYRYVLLEKYVAGIEYSVETLSLRGRHQLIGITDKRLAPDSLVEQCHIYPAEVPAVVRVERAIALLLDTIGHLHGPMHIEIKIEGEAIHLIEINNRPGGDYIWDMVNKVSGVNLVAETLRYAFEGEPDETQRQARRRYGAMAYVALFQPLSPTLINEKWHETLPLDRVQCSSPTRTGAISNSFERPGFILAGEKNRTALDAALPALASWIATQSER